MILDSAWMRVFGPSTADVEAMAAHLDEWIGIKRRARANVRAAADLIGNLSDYSGPIPADVVAKARAAEAQANDAWEQVKAHDAEIMDYAQRAADAGYVDQAAVDDYRRRLDDAAAGLGSIGIFGALAAGIVIVAASVGFSILMGSWRLTSAIIKRLNDTTDVNTRGAQLAQDWQIRHADQTGTPPDMPTTIDTKTSPLVSVGLGAGGVGFLIAAIGGLLLLNSRGSRRK